jgi:hypothetical protein
MVTRKEVEKLRNGQNWNINKLQSIALMITYFDWLDTVAGGGDNGGGSNGGGGGSGSGAGEKEAVGISASIFTTADATATSTC